MKLDSRFIITLILVSLSACTDAPPVSKLGTDLGSQVEVMLSESSPSQWSLDDENAVQAILMSQATVNSMNATRYSLDELQEVYLNQMNESLSQANVRYSEIEPFIESLADLRTENDHPLLMSEEILRVSILVSRAYHKAGGSLYQIAATDFANLIRRRIYHERKENALTEIEALKASIQAILKLSDQDLQKVMESA